MRADSSSHYTDERSSNPIRHAVPLISQVRSYPPYPFHLHPPSLSFSSTTLPSFQEHKVKSSLSISPCHHYELTPSAAYADCSKHRVQQTLKMLCGLFIRSISSGPLNLASASGVHLTDQLPTDSSPQEFQR